MIKVIKSKYKYTTGKYGNKIWTLNGKLHREDGHAYEMPGGYKEWWLNGKLLSEEEHFELVSKENQIKILFRTKE